MNPTRRDVLRILECHFGPAALVPEWQWRPVDYGVCGRCYWPSHTLGPDGRPWHPFCWLNDDPPSSFDQWVLHKDGSGEWGSRPDGDYQDRGERQWCAVQGAWFDPTPERLKVCEEHAAEMVGRWRR